MMGYAPEKIYQDYSNHKLSSASAIDLLISLIEKSERDDLRLESVKVLELIGNLPEKVFKFLEDLFVSESNQNIRLQALKIVKSFFLHHAFSLMKWALQHESKIECLLEIVNAMKLLGTESVKNLLIKEVRKICKIKTLPSKTLKSRNFFRRDLKQMLKSRNIEDFLIKELAEILMNFKALYSLKKRFFSVQYELKNARVTKLDLSDVEFEVRGWKSEYRNNIQSLSEIPELLALNTLESLDLSNNHLSCVKQLTSIPTLSQIYLSNNDIVDIQNMKYFKQLPRLMYLDLYGNEIAQKIDPHEFDLVVVKLKRNFI